MILATNGYVNTYGDIMTDLTFTSDPVITESGMALYINGTVFRPNKGYSIPQVAIADVQVLPSTPESV